MQQRMKYSDEELAEFKELVLVKMEKAKRQLELLQRQIQETAENSDDDFGSDWIDDCNVHTQLEMLSDMATRQRKYINNLENALLRIKNKTYGICEVTGELIDKRRLIAVPTTTKSLDAKANIEARNRLSTAASRDEDETEKEEVSKQKEIAAPKVISRIIKKSGGNVNKPAPKHEEEHLPDFWDDEDFSADNVYLDPDDLAEETEDREFEIE